MVFKAKSSHLATALNKKRRKNMSRRAQLTQESVKRTRKSARRQATEIVKQQKGHEELAKKIHKKTPIVQRVKTPDALPKGYPPRQEL